MLMHVPSPFQKHRPKQGAQSGQKGDAGYVLLSRSASWWMGKSREFLGESDLCLASARDLMSRLGISHVLASREWMFVAAVMPAAGVRGCATAAVAGLRV